MCKVIKRYNSSCLYTDIHSSKPKRPWTFCLNVALFSLDVQIVRSHCCCGIGLDYSSPPSDQIVRFYICCRGCCLGIFCQICPQRHTNTCTLWSCKNLKTFWTLLLLLLLTQCQLRSVHRVRETERAALAYKSKFLEWLEWPTLTWCENLLAYLLIGSICHSISSMSTYENTTDSCSHTKYLVLITCGELPSVGTELAPTALLWGT